MEITIISATSNPVDVIAIAAGTSYGKSDTSEKRVRFCFDRGHMSVFEHASVTFRVEGISRACSHQLVRHRLASFVQKSQRYTKIDASSDDWYVIPPSFNQEPLALGFSYEDFFVDEMRDSAYAYESALENGIKPEDARYLLPEATKTEITCTMNVRELFHFLNMRTDKAAQWEIREVAERLWQDVAAISDQWGMLMGLWTLGAGDE